MRKQYGVTTLSIVIVVVVLAILASASILYSRDVVSEGKLATTYDEIKQVKDAVVNLKSLSEINPESYNLENILGVFEITNIDEYNARVGMKLNSTKKYYYLGFADENLEEGIRQNLSDIFEIRSVSNNYIISVEALNDIEIFLVDGITVGEEVYYTFDEILTIYSGTFEN